MEKATKLIHRAATTNDPRKLHEIANELDAMGEREAADKVREIANEKQEKFSQVN